ncbi:MAG TPA: LysM peptidoglycan-binding domain-containing protein [Acholeplasmataceae bacterium]|jgi:hypothetical protein|nr:LysM peptidoglycan-binding domain-containing protein [Acholeplasmataceae bacterium]
MKFHIVRNNETLEDILFLYNVTKAELMEYNQHIRVWNKIVPGTKLKIPPITEAVEQDVSDMEPFVEDYYPKLNYKEYAATPDEDIPLEASTAPEGADKQPEITIEMTKKDTSGVPGQTDPTMKPGYPPELLKKAKAEAQVVQPTQIIGYAYPHGYYGYQRVVPYQVVYYPYYQQKKSK